MSGSILDLFTETFNGQNPASSTVANSRAMGATTLVCQSLVGWPTNTAVHFATYQKDATGAKIAGTQTDWKGVVSGSSINTLTQRGGAADSGNGIGDIVEMMPTYSWAQDLATGLELQHLTTGTHQNITTNTIATTGNASVGGNLSVTGTASLTGAVTLPSNTVTNANLSTTAGQIGAAWVAWTPTWTNLTIGNGTNDAKFLQVGKLIYYRLVTTLGSTSAVGTGPTFTLPITSITVPSTTLAIGQGAINNTSGTFNALANWNTTTTALLRYWDTNNNGNGVTATTPGTWATGWQILLEGFYEAA